MENGGPFSATQIFNDIGQVSGVEMGQLFLGDTELEKV
jgi:hypothetical protein